jgi:ribosomally synthesized peptide (two-chain TOMM family)
MSHHDKSNYGTYDRFLAYRAAIMQAIALAWKNPDFEKAFIENPIKALKDGVGYDFPFNMKVSVNDQNAEWEPKIVGDWHITKQDKLVFALPPAPKESEQVEALAAFNANQLTFLN